MGGGDKGLLPFGPGSVLSTVIARFEPQVAALAINANGDPERFGAFGLSVLPDGVPGFPGPLAGVLAAMDWAFGQGAFHVVTVPSDAPFLPCDLVPRLLLADAALAVAATAGRLHPTAALWSVDLRVDMAATLARGERRVRDFTDRHNATVVDFPAGPPDPFLNINTPADLDAARGWL